jgi:phage-related protein
MAIWCVVFFPEAGETDSPFDYITSRPENEAAQIIHRLETIAELETVNWPPKWTKKIDGEIHQLTAGRNRLYYCLGRGTIVILHACKKAGRKARRKDINRAGIHYSEYSRLTKGTK